jgi:hypothetical protein
MTFSMTLVHVTKHTIHAILPTVGHILETNSNKQITYRITFFFNASNPSSIAMALGFTQSITEMSTGKFLWVTRRQRVRLTA